MREYEYVSAIAREGTLSGAAVPPATGASAVGAAGLSAGRAAQAPSASAADLRRVLKGIDAVAAAVRAGSVIEMDGREFGRAVRRCQA